MDRAPFVRLTRSAQSIAIALPLIAFGCKSTAVPISPVTTAKPATASAQQAQYPSRPAVPPPPFKIFHHDASSITLVTASDATDDQIAAILWQLHDAARTHAFDKLHISQKEVDARDPIIWFHLYRGSKCADEKYTTAKLPCGPSYHAAGDYTLGGFSNKNRDDGVLLHGDDKQMELWNPDTT